MSRAALTSSDEILALVAQLWRQLVVADELLDAEAVQRARAQVEERRYTQQHNGYGEINVETAADELDNVHVTHDLETIIISYCC